MRVHIGCGETYMDGWVNCDLTAGKADLVFDAQEPWPREHIPEASVTHILASHVLEHMDKPVEFINECWKALVPNGTLSLRMPYGGHRSAWWDITHLRPWYPESFGMFQPGYYKYNGNPQHAHHGKEMPWGIMPIGIRISQHAYELFRRRRFRWFLQPLVNNLVDIGEELFVDMFALKREEDVDQYKRDRGGPTEGYEAFTVPVTWVCYEHQTKGRSKAKDGEPIRLVPVFDIIGTASFRGRVWIPKG